MPLTRARARAHARVARRRRGSEQTARSQASATTRMVVLVVVLGVMLAAPGYADKGFDRARAPKERVARSTLGVAIIDNSQEPGNPQLGRTVLNGLLDELEATRKRK